MNVSADFEQVKKVISSTVEELPEHDFEKEMLALRNKELENTIKVLVEVLKTKEVES